MVAAVLDRTRTLWAKQDRHVGDRERLFTAVAETVEASTVLYPGSYVDLAPSFVWPAVTYVDVDRRAAQFFGDVDGIQELLAEHGVDNASHVVRFIGTDYTKSLALDIGAFDLLISLYAGFISEHCTQYLRVGGTLLVNPSHGDVAMASIDPRYRLRGVIAARSGRYSVTSEDPDTYLQPNRDVEVTSESLHASRRGVPYTRSPFAYLFERIA